MKRFASTLLILLAIVCLTSCKKACRCYHYNGSVTEFDLEELSEQGIACVEMENFDYGLVYSLCERVF